jgi:hypothetical protein
MRVLVLCLVAVAATLIGPMFAGDVEKSIDSRVVKIKLPVADVELNYVEANHGMAIEMVAGTTKISGTRFYVGDGKVAVLMEADPLNGIRFQESRMLVHGYIFKKYSIVELQPNCKSVGDLEPGDVYIEMPALSFVKK